MKRMLRPGRLSLPSPSTPAVTQGSPTPTMTVTIRQTGSGYWLDDLCSVVVQHCNKYMKLQVTVKYVPTTS